MLSTIVNFCATESSLMWPPEAKKETLLYVMVLQLFYAKALFFERKPACSISLEKEAGFNKFHPHHLKLVFSSLKVNLLYIAT